jgi:hypothetical protein
MNTPAPMMIEKHSSNKRGPISVRSYFDANTSNMGLEKYGISLYDGVMHEEQLACVESNGLSRYLTGLNEFAPEVVLEEDAEKRAAMIKDIRETISQLERVFASNIVDPTDKEFWNKVKVLKPDNHDFWGKISIRCGNQPLILDPKDPNDLIKIRAIEAGGFSGIAKSYDIARAMTQAPKFYLDKFEETVATKNEPRKMKNKALAELQKMFDKNTNKLFYVAKVVDGNSIQYKKSTPNDVLYDNMDKYINGETFEKNAARAAKTFLDACNADMETLKIRALIKDATYMKLLALNSDGFIKHMESNSPVGKNPSEILEFLKNPLNEKILDTLMNKVETEWQK